jgi:hypothetical protein
MGDYVTGPGATKGGHRCQSGLLLPTLNPIRGAFFWVIVSDSHGFMG